MVIERAAAHAPVILEPTLRDQPTARLILYVLTRQILFQLIQAYYQLQMLPLSRPWTRRSFEICENFLTKAMFKRLLLCEGLTQFIQVFDGGWCSRTSAGESQSVLHMLVTRWVYLMF